MGSVKNAESNFKFRMFIKFTYVWITIKGTTMDTKCISVLVEL